MGGQDGIAFGVAGLGDAARVPDFGILLLLVFLLLQLLLGIDVVFTDLHYIVPVPIGGILESEAHEVVH